MQLDLAAILLLIIVIIFALVMVGSFLYLVVYRQYRRSVDANKHWLEREAKKCERKKRKERKQKRR